MWSGRVVFSPALSNRSGGVSIAFNTKYYWQLSEVRRDSIGRCISIFCSVQGVSFRLCNVHAPNYPSDRKAFLNDCYMYTHGRNPLILGGDFNCVMSNLDGEGSSANQGCFSGKKEIIELISAYNLFDCYRKVYPSLPGHTWYRAGKSSRLDRIYLHKDFHVSSVGIIPCPFSDYNAVNVRFKISSQPPKGRGYWKYNVSLNKNELFRNELRYYYGLWVSLKPGFNSLLDWWDDTKHRVKGLAIKHCVRLAREKRKQQVSLLNNFVHCSQEVAVRIVEEELRGAQIRSRVKLLEEGEKSAAFFFREEKRRSDKRTIKCIRNRDGSITSDHVEIMGRFHEFYSDLFSSHECVDEGMQNLFVQSLHSRVRENDKVMLDQSINLQEIKKALSLVAKNKSPGLDGLPYDFYGEFIDMLGNDLVEVFN
ncbi:hypothetical protein HOLleu_39763 [Holothuria leucospilota]|uniref:Endonuclease/exonuclease/phosphatase domain-containing protein n=1 Tax=Holothuria leucospilota TaxID=206669 RepID=A0A9Q0YEE1_HOLLE|nr:hypothetical protein HOLleu_39763 [Holothuria leucospilota]